MNYDTTPRRRLVEVLDEKSAGIESQWNGAQAAADRGPDTFASVDDAPEEPGPGGKHKAPPVDGPECVEGEVPAEVGAGFMDDAQGGDDVPF